VVDPRVIGGGRVSEDDRGGCVYLLAYSGVNFDSDPR